MPLEPLKITKTDTIARSEFSFPSKPPDTLELLNSLPSPPVINTFGPTAVHAAASLMDSTIKNGSAGSRRTATADMRKTGLWSEFQTQLPSSPSLVPEDRFKRRQKKMRRAIREAKLTKLHNASNVNSDDQEEDDNEQEE